MEGVEGDRGVNARALAELFRLADARAGECRYKLSVSMLEVYNETIRDLLAPPLDRRRLPAAEDEEKRAKLDIRQASSSRGGGRLRPRCSCSLPSARFALLLCLTSPPYGGKGTPSDAPPPTPPRPPTGP